LPEVQFFFSVGWARNPILSLSLSPHTPNNQKNNKEKETHSTTVHNKTQNDELSQHSRHKVFFFEKTKILRSSSEIQT
jgi:hypothetical protein